MQPAAFAGLLGSASLLTATYGKICVELNRTPIGSCERHAGSSAVTMVATIQGK